MKKLFILSVFCSLFVSCDKVDKPLVNYVPPVEPRRKVLLEDYTGQKCGNCPRAAELIETMHKKYGEDLVVVSIHAGDFAKTDAEYPTSYTTVPGNDWNMYFIGNAGAYPAGAVNRKAYSQSVIQFQFSKWSTIVEAGFNDEYIMNLDITPSYDPEGRQLDVTVKGKFLKNYPNKLMVTVLLTEDSIIGPQTDYAYGKHENYVFTHMMRASVNGSWGSPFTTGAMSKGDSLSVSWRDYTVDSKFKSRNLSVVAYAYDATTREVLEVERVQMYPATSK